MNRDAFIRQAKAQIEDYKVKLEILKARIREGLAEGELETAEAINSLEGKLDQLNSRLEDLTSVGEQIWDETKKGMQKAWNDLDSVLKKIRL